MRILLKVTMPTESANAVAKSGRLGAKIKEILEEQKPEAAYFTEIDGQRTAFLILDLDDPATIPSIAEPWFLAFSARVELHPVMLLSDLERAGTAIQAAVRKHAA